MKDIRINGRMNRVFVLKETNERIVYIPVKSLHEVDYHRLKEIESRGGDMLDRMAETTLENGRNALVQYDDLIQVLIKTGTNAGERLRKPSEPVVEAPVLTQVLVEKSNEQPVAQVQQLNDTPVRRKPGPRPKNQIIE